MLSPERTAENVIGDPGRGGDSHGFGFRAKRCENAIVFFLLFTMNFFLYERVFLHSRDVPTRIPARNVVLNGYDKIQLRRRRIAKYGENDERSRSVIFLVCYSRFVFDFLDFSIDFFGLIFFFNSKRTLPERLSMRVW